MKRIIFILFSILLIPNHAFCGNLDDLINKNILDATTALEKSTPGSQQTVNPIRLWIHVWNDKQVTIAQEIQKILANIESKQWEIENKPIQQVTSGPNHNQLRYFRKSDEMNAQQIHKLLQDVIPQLEIKDFSSSYENVSWIKPGHYELWFSPDLNTINIAGAGPGARQR